MLFRLILSGIFEFHEEFWVGVSDAAKDLIRKLLTVDPEQRLTAREALRHPWVGVSAAALKAQELARSKAVVRRWQRRRTLRRVYFAVVASNRMRRLARAAQKVNIGAGGRAAAAAAGGAFRTALVWLILLLWPNELQGGEMPVRV